LARITFYETGQIVSVNRDGTVTANFDPGALGRVQSGQAALLHLNDVSQDLAEPIPSIVVSVTGQGQEEQIQVELYILGEAIALISPQDNLTGQVEVEVERISPATLVMRASGLSTDSPALSTSPQQPPE
jgi:membrane fusion protein (multidrug efflux system)